jgi:hypothetical protein
MRLGLGDTAACGTNPCSTWDMTVGATLPFLGLMSSQCQAYLACAVTGAAVTPDPSTIPSLNTGTPGAGGGGVQDAEAACAAGGNTWNALTGQCVPSTMVYLPWLVAAAAALLILPPLLSRR